MFALVETWFSSLSSSFIPRAGETPTRTARAISSCIRSLIDALAPPPSVLRSLQLLFALCLSGGDVSCKSAHIRAAAQLGIDGLQYSDSVELKQPDNTPTLWGDFVSSVDFLFPTEE
jgi:hypothetical protein